ncbi:DUF2971 domain-containing protein [Nitrosomonas sp. Nm33]|uniref:DUF2971 domain-containing protein n=1 Tax=Nitrosomonas sp. Nm33 TaxID=133724 RepID=UPI0015A4E1B5|nr:DUF2971 domain-containing protein [Nitrosomonas sp. Nm33]
MLDPHEYSNISPIFGLTDPSTLDPSRSGALVGQPEEVQQAVLAHYATQRAELEKYNRHVLDLEMRHMAAQAVCCWRHDSSESHAMWQVYAPSAEGIAIRTTVERLKASIADKRSIDIGMVSYYDSSGHFPTEKKDVGQLRVVSAAQTNVDQCLHKQPWYEYERELRVLLINERFPEPLAPPELYVDVNLDILLDAIVLSPTAPSWFENVVRNVAGSYIDRIARSAMAQPRPIYQTQTALGRVRQ